MKYGMGVDADDHVEIAGRAAARSGVAFAGQSNALAVARACLDANFQRLGAADCAFTVAGWAGGDVFACAFAVGTLHVELHAAAGLRDLSGAVALGAFSRRFDVPLPVASWADILTGDIEAHHAAANRCPERHVYLIFEIAARFGAGLGCGCSAAATEDSGEDVAKAATAAGFALAAGGVVREVGEIEAAEIEGNALAAGWSG